MAAMMRDESALRTTTGPESGLGVAKSVKPLFNKPRTTGRTIFANTAPTEQALSKSRGERARIYSLSDGMSKDQASRATAKPLSLLGAYARVVEKEEEEKLRTLVGRDGSPSPAGRTSDGASKLRNARRERGSPLGHHDTNVWRQPNGARNNQHSESADSSSVSGSIGDDATDDDIGRKISSYARDQDRARSARGSGHGIFTKGVSGTKVEETVNTLNRRTSATSLEMEPEIKIPQQWGRKAKKGNAYLKRILSPDSSGEVNLPPPPVEEGTVNWAEAAAGVPLPSVENESSTAQEPTPPSSRPSSVQPVGMSPEKSQMWDADLDFTARSIHVSTSPQLRIRNTKLDDIRARELEPLSKKALATSRLEEIRERNSEERSLSPDVLRIPENGGPAKVPVRRKTSALEVLSTATRDTLAKVSSWRSSQGQPGAAEVPMNDVPSVPLVGPSRGRKTSSEVAAAAMRVLDVPFVDIIHSASEPPHERTILEEEGEAIPGTPITIFRNSSKTLAAQPGHKRDDSYDSLRRLARITSASPSPGLLRHESRPADELLQNANEIPLDIKRLSNGSSPPKSDVDPEERIAAEASLFDLPDNKSDRNSVREPSPVSDTGMDETPRPRRDPLSHPTPIVTGAYLDTPAPTARQANASRPMSPTLQLVKTVDENVSRFGPQSTMIESSATLPQPKVNIPILLSSTNANKLVSSNSNSQLLKPKPAPRPRPPLKNTAHPASVKDDLRRIRQEAFIDDSTMDDFDELLDATEDDFDLNSTTIIEPRIDLDKDDKGQPLSDKERERRLEMMSLERMGKSLKTGLKSIRDAKRGIERLEDRVSSSPDPAHSHSHSGCSECEKSNPDYHLMISLPRFWARDPTRRKGFRLTWLGFIVLLFITWLLAETITCDYICHPTYSYTNNWKPDDPFWGGALPKLADRLSGGVLGFAKNLLWRIFAWVWDVWSGVGEMHGNLKTSTVPAFKLSAWSDGSIFEDEAI